MKERELRALGNCGLCGKPLAHSGLPLFWKVSVQRFGIDLAALQRQAGLTQMLGGNAFLAATMGPAEDMAKPLEDRTIAVCEPCAAGPTSVYQLGMPG